MLKYILTELGYKLARVVPPQGVFKTGDEVSWAGKEGVVISTTGQNGAPVQVFLKTGKGIIIGFDDKGRFFREDARASRSLEFIKRPKIFLMEVPGVPKDENAQVLAPTDGSNVTQSGAAQPEAPSS